MDLRQLQCFVAVAEELHFSRAAERLGISQPPLSQHIQALEKDLAVRLFDRTNRRVAITAAGESLLVDARRILLQFEQARASVDRSKRGEMGRIEIGINSSGAFARAVPRLLFEFRRRYPGVDMIVNEMPSAQQLTALLQDRTLEAGVLRGRQLPDELDAVELMREPLVVVMHGSHVLATDLDTPVELERFANDDFLLFPRALSPGYHDRVIGLCHRAGFSPHIVQEIRELPSIPGFVAAGFGVSILPGSMRSLRMDDMVYREIAGDDATTSIWLAYRRHSTSPLLQPLVALARELSLTRTC